MTFARAKRAPPPFWKVNANGRIPVLQMERRDRFLPESNAACWYLAMARR
jgi:glutathione S-transferase